MPQLHATPLPLAPYSAVLSVSLVDKVMRKHRLIPRAGRIAGSSGRSSDARLEAQREALLRRLARLDSRLRSQPGYRTAQRLLNPMYRRASLAARVAILQSAAFMLDVLELMPPL
jgi:hypothetical protein